MRVGRNKMNLTPDQKQKIVEFLNSKWPEPQACPICRAQAWILPDFLTESRETHTKNARTYPLITIICNNCGYTFFLNAMVAKIIEEMKAPNEDRDSSTKDNNSKK